MKVMLHGATNLSNFGDYIFAELFYNKLKNNGVDVEFYVHPKYGISQYFMENLGYTPSVNNGGKLMSMCDALVYISGGYFVEPRKKGLISEIKHVKRYLTPGYYFMKKRKPVYIMGVGAGPFENALFSRKAKELINYASVVTVRNEKSLELCRDFGITRDVIVTADTALLIKNYMEENKKGVIDCEVLNDKKVIMLHIDSNREVKDILIRTFRPAIEMFLNRHKDYQLYLISDGLKTDDFYNDYEHAFSICNPIVLRYDNPWMLCRQLEKADIVITTKLHVGIVSSSLGRSVISFPFVPNKTKRFYKQIGELDRCVSLSEVSKDKNQIFNMIEKYAGCSIRVPDEIISKANVNLDLLPGIN